MKKLFVLFCIAAAAVGGYLLLAGKPGEKREDQGTAPPPVRLVAAEGKVEVIPGFEVEVGSEIDGKIIRLTVEEGDTVKKGDLIAVIENRDIMAKHREAGAELSASEARLQEVATGSRKEEIAQAEAALEAAAADRETAMKERERHDNLFRDGLIARSLVDEKERAFRVAEAREREAAEKKQLLEKGPKQETVRYHEESVKRARALVDYVGNVLEKTRITAPISGTVIRKYLHKGEIISREMNTAIVAVADLDRIRINAEVDETDIGRFKIGDPAEVKSDAYPGKVFSGEVEDIADYVGARRFKPNNPARNVDIKVIQVKIMLKERSTFIPGMTVDVRIIPRGGSSGA